MLLSPRYLPRMAAMVGLFTRYGLADFARRQGLESVAPDAFRGLDPEGQEEMAAKAHAFRKRLVELGPAFVKLGQVLSTRPDLLPEPYIEELEHLQDDVGAVPLSNIEEIIEQELGARISKLFSSFEPEPLGTASLGQVHGATLRDGRSVVVKVQRPDIRQSLADDLEFFREAARFLTDHTSSGERVDMIGIVQQLERALTDELDYRIEARNAATFRRALASYPHLLIPRVIEAYTSERVLTSERIKGVKIDKVPAVARIEHDFSALADEFSKAYLQQITIDGHFHADPHPGNVFLVLPGRENPMTPAEVVASDRRETPRPATTPLSRIEEEARKEAAPAAEDHEAKLALIDFGMTAHLSAGMRECVVRFLLAVAENRGDSAAEALIEMGEPAEHFDRAAYVRAISSLVSRNFDRAIGEIHTGHTLYEMIDTSYRNRLRLPAELTLLAKALFNLDSVSRSLDPSYSPMQTIRDFGDRIASDRAKKEMSMSRLYQMATQTSDLLRALPHRVDTITARMASGDFGFQVQAPQVQALLEGLQKVANRIFSGLVLCGLLIASAMLFPYQRHLGQLGFIAAAAIGLYLVGSILVSDRKSG